MAAFFVDGKMEQMFVQNVCPGAKVQLINCNGDRVKLEAIADRLATLLRLLRSRYSPVIIIFDREKRDKTTEELSRELSELLLARGVTDRFYIGVPDRMIENWILADEEVKAELSKEIKDTHFEGSDGKAHIRKYVSPYHETVDGVSLLRRCRPGRMLSSPSFRSFFDQFRADLSLQDCWWVKA